MTSGLISWCTAICPTFTLNSFFFVLFLNTNYDLSTSTHPQKLRVTSQSFELCWHSSLPCNQELFYSWENLWMQLTVWKARKSAAFCTPGTIGATQCTMNFASHHCNPCKYLQSEWHISRTPHRVKKKKQKEELARCIPLLHEGYLCLPFTAEAVGTSACFMEVF